MPRSAPPRHRRGGRGVLALVVLAVPVVATAAVPVYSRLDPQVLGVPFFYSYQLAWVPLSILCMAVSLRLTRGRDDD